MENQLTHFGDGNSGKHTHKQENQRGEETERAYESGQIPDCGRVTAPRGRQENARKTNHDDDETLEPHTHVHNDGHEKKHRDVGAHRAYPQQLRSQNIAKDQRVVEVRIRPMKPLFYEKDVEFLAAVHGHKKFKEIPVSDNQASGEHHLGHIFQMTHGDEIFEVIILAKRNGDGQHHREAGINGACHEVRRENSSVPAGNNGNREIKAHHGVYGQNQGCGQPRKQQVRRLIPVPVPRGAAPAHSQQSVSFLFPTDGGAITKGRQIWNEADEPKQQRNGAVSRIREHGPDQRAAELRPDAHGAGIREHVVGHPRAASVDKRKQAGARYCEERHGLRETIDGGAPLLIEQIKNGGNQRAGVANTNPPYEIDDGKSPTDGNVDGPNSDALDDQPTDGYGQHAQNGKRHGKPGKPTQSW